MQAIGDIISSEGGITTAKIECQCPEHGPYTATQTIIGGSVVNTSKCPVCKRLFAEAMEREGRKYLQEQAAHEARMKLEKALSRSCIPEEYKAKTFDNFEAVTENQKGALDLAQRFAKGWDKAKDGGYGLLFFGNPGTGKSHLACAIIHALLSQTEGLYTRAMDVIQYVRSTWGPKSERSTYEASRIFIDIPLLVIDEVGVQAGSENERQILFSIIDSRISENRPTIFLSNLRPADLSEVLGPRLVDRIRGKCVPYQFSGKSMRKPITADVFGEAA